ncbi:hypothetical protein ABAC460_15970 [Asticcacaulis sp. AC460]|uniref:UrcA family protein n=1 Tax=Asticcacaulis sp. AC460 TaxID=1282360 RepID=UPI0003C3C53F|nr:UrcA family protein [Asticcacaulis sp. AC460]ESQ88156.1 hypothetical protein ABAC460_15970 [Asticcacaulis sp. AC460]
MIRTVTTIAFSAIVALTAGTALAGDYAVAVGEPGQSQEVISLDGVDLSNPAEAKTFYRSLQYAAARVCVGESRSCDAEAVSDAVRQIGSPELARLDDAGDRAPQMAAAENGTSQR